MLACLLFISINGSCKLLLPLGTIGNSTVRVVAQVGYEIRTLVFGGGYKRAENGD